MNLGLKWLYVMCIILNNYLFCKTLPWGSRHNKYSFFISFKKNSIVFYDRQTYSTFIWVQVVAERTWAGDFPNCYNSMTLQYRKPWKPFVQVLIQMWGSLVQVTNYYLNKSYPTLSLIHVIILTHDLHYIFMNFLYMLVLSVYDFVLNLKVVYML